MTHFDFLLQEAIANIRTNHHKIIDDWCKAYLAQLHGLGLDIRPGCFVLNQMPFNEGNNVGYKYWFTLKGSNMKDDTPFESTVREMFESACTAILDEEIDEPGFNLCVNTIHTTLTYLKMKREKKEKEK